MAAHRLLTVGKPRDPCLASWVDEYIKRIRGWVNWTWESIAEESFATHDQHRALIKEDQALGRRIRSADWVVLMSISGQMLDSRGLSQKLNEWYDQGRTLCVVVGGSLGVGPEVEQRANWKWSLSPLTLPHALAQVVTMEQIYRAAAIANGHAYHK